MPYGLSASTLPGEPRPESPFPNGATLRFLLDSKHANTNSKTGTLVGFGQVEDSKTGDYENMCIYHVDRSRRAVFSNKDHYKVFVEYVITNGINPKYTT